MKQKEFEGVVNHRLEKCKETLGLKGAIYADKNDRLKNFYDGAALNECTPEQYAFMLVTKHIVAIKDHIRDSRGMSEAFIDEKITDVINYMLLIEALVEDK
jgi:hypothetical protein